MASGKLLRASNLMLAGVLLAGVVVFARPAAPVSALQDAPRNLAVFEQAADGDLIFRAGRDMVSAIVMAQNAGAQFSHVGVVVRRDGKVMVVHALPSEGNVAGGVVVEPLSVFASAENASGLAVYRMPHLEPAARVQIRDYALSQVGKPFDDDFSMTDDSRVYCAELAVKAYSAAKLDIAPTDSRVSIMTVDEPVVLPDALSKAVEVRRIVGVVETL